MISQYLENRVLGKIFRREDFEVPAVYISLHKSAPGDDGAGEINGGNYRRRAAEFGPVTLGTARNTRVLEWDQLPAGEIRHVGFWDAARAGHFLWGASLGHRAALSAGDAFRIGIGDIIISFGEGEP